MPLNSLTLPLGLGESLVEVRCRAAGARVHVPPEQSELAIDPGATSRAVVAGIDSVRVSAALWKCALA